MDKLERMRDQLGHDQVYDVVSSVLDAGQVRLDTLIREAILNRRSMEDILGDLEFVDSLASVAAARDALGEALATSHIDMGSILGDERDSKERRLTPEFVERFFADGLRYLGGRIAAGTDRDWSLDFVPADVRREAQAQNTGEFGTGGRLVTFDKGRLRRRPARRVRRAEPPALRHGYGPPPGAGTPSARQGDRLRRQGGARPLPRVAPGGCCRQRNRGRSPRTAACAPATWDRL